MLYHQTHFSTLEVWHFLSPALFIPGRIYPLRHMAFFIPGIFYHRNILSRECFIPGRIYHGKHLSLEEFITGRIYPWKNLSLYIKKVASSNQKIQKNLDLELNNFGMRRVIIFCTGISGQEGRIYDCSPPANISKFEFSRDVFSSEGKVSQFNDLTNHNFISC